MNFAGCVDCKCVLFSEIRTAAVTEPLADPSRQSAGLCTLQLRDKELTLQRSLRIIVPRVLLVSPKPKLWAGGLGFRPSSCLSEGPGPFLGELQGKN